MAPSRTPPGWAKISEIQHQNTAHKKNLIHWSVLNVKVFLCKWRSLRHCEDKPQAVENGRVSHTRCRTWIQNRQLSKLSNKTTNNPIKKPLVKTSVVDKHRGCAIPSATWEMQIKATVRHLTLRQNNENKQKRLPQHCPGCGVRGGGPSHH